MQGHTHKGWKARRRHVPVVMNLAMVIVMKKLKSGLSRYAATRYADGIEVPPQGPNNHVTRSNSIRFFVLTFPLCFSNSF